MPRDAFAVAGRFADEVAGKKGDIRTNDRLNQCEHILVEEPFEQLGTDEVRHVHRFGPDVGGKIGEQLFKAILEALEFFPG